MKLRLPKRLKTDVIICMALSVGLNSTAYASVGMHQSDNPIYDVEGGFLVTTRGSWVNDPWIVGYQGISDDGISFADSHITITGRGSMVNVFGGHVAYDDYYTKSESVEILIQDIDENGKVASWLVGGSLSLRTTGYFTELKGSAYLNVRRTDVKVLSGRDGSDNFYVYGSPDDLKLPSGFVSPAIAGAGNAFPHKIVSTGPISLIGGNMTQNICNNYPSQSIIRESTNVHISAGHITGHVVGASTVLTERMTKVPDFLGGQFQGWDDLFSDTQSDLALGVWVEESNVTMTHGYMEKGWAHGDISHYDEMSKKPKNAIAWGMSPRIVGGHMLYVSSIASAFGSFAPKECPISDGYDENLSGIGVGDVNVTITGDASVYDVVGGSWVMLDFADVNNGVENKEKGYINRDVQQGNIKVVLDGDITVKGDVIAGGIQGGRTTIASDSTTVEIGSNVRFKKDTENYDYATDTRVPVDTMFEINGSHTIVDGGYMLSELPIAIAFYTTLDDGIIIPHEPVGNIPISLPLPEKILPLAGHYQIGEAIVADDELLSKIEKKAYWKLGEFERGSIGRYHDKNDYSVYEDHPYVRENRTLVFGDAATYKNVDEVYFINFDKVTVAKGARVTVGALVIDDDQTTSADGVDPGTEGYTETRYENNVLEKYRNRSKTSIEGGGEIRMHAGFEMDAWYWISGTYDTPLVSEPSQKPGAFPFPLDWTQYQYLIPVHETEILNNTHLEVVGEGTKLHLLPRETSDAGKAVSYVYKVDAHSAGTLHVDVAPKLDNNTHRNTMYVLQQLNIHDGGCLKMSVNVTADMTDQAHAAIHKVLADDPLSGVPGSIKEIRNQDTQTVNFEKGGYFDLRLREVATELYKDELYIVLIDRVNGNNVGIKEGETPNYIITNRTKEQLERKFGSQYSYDKELAGTATWDKNHVWIGVEKVTDGPGAEEAGREGQEDWAMVIRAKRTNDEPDYNPTPIPPVLEPVPMPEPTPIPPVLEPVPMPEPTPIPPVLEPITPPTPEPPSKPGTHYHRRHANTPNGVAGGDLMDEYFDNSLADADDDREKVLDRIIDLNAEDHYAESDRLQVAVAGSSLSVLALAAADDVERQMRLMRNRSGKSLTQELTRMRQRQVDGGKAGIRIHEYPEAVPAKKLTLWLNAEGEYNSMQERSTDPGFRLNSWGGTVGAAATLSRNIETGLAITAMYGDLQSKGPDNLKGDMDTSYLSTFVRVESGKWTHSFIATVGLVDMDGTRSVNIGGEYGGYTTHYDTEGYALGLMYEAAYTVAGNRDKTSLYQAVANIAWRHVSLDGFTETGDTSAKLRAGDQKVDSLILGLGGRAQWLVGGDMLNRGSVLELRVLGKGYTGDLRNRVNVGFADREHEAKVRSRKQGALGAEIGAGYTLPLNSGTGDYEHSLFIEVNYELRRACGDMNATFGYRLMY